MKETEFSFPNNLSTFDIMFSGENATELPTLHLQNLSDWGPKRDPLFIVIPFTVLFATIFLTGLIGNVSTCIVIARNRSMHTATNYYLFSLAISDLLLLISGLPQEMYYIWSKYPYVFGETLCVLQGFAAETSANATVLTITAFTVERYVAICHPFLSHTVSKLSRAIKLVIMIWIFAMCLAVPQAMAFGIVYEELPEETPEDDDHYICNVKRIVIPHAFLISTVLFFVAPMSLITVLYILIGLQLRQSTVGPVRGGSIKLNHLVYKKALIAHSNKSNRTSVEMNDNESSSLQLSPQEQDERKTCLNQSQAASQHVVKMLVAVVVAFFICWAPFHAQRLLAIYGQSNSSDMAATFSALTYISGVLYYLSTTVNPVLYHIMSHKFRMAFKETYAQCLRKKGQRRMPLHYSTLSRRSSQDKSNFNPSNGRNLFDSKPPHTSNKSVKRKKRICKGGRNVIYLNPELIKTSPKDTQYSYLECNDKFDEPSHCIVNGANLKNICSFKDRLENSFSRDNCRKLEEIEIFKEEQFCIKSLEKLRASTSMCGTNSAQTNSRRRSSPCQNITKLNNSNRINSTIKKSATMPSMRENYFKLPLPNGRDRSFSHCYNQALKNSNIMHAKHFPICEIKSTTS